MANFFVTNHRYPRNPQQFTVNISKYSSVGGEDNPNFKPSYPSAEPYWKVVIYTSGKDGTGKEVGPVIADVLGGLDTVNDLVNEKIQYLCSIIDWTSQGQFAPEDDSGAPVIAEQYPSAGEDDVPISAGIRIVLEDILPSTGINISTLSFKVNGLAVNPKVEGNKYRYVLTYNPRPVHH